MNYVPKCDDAKQLSELLDKACSLIITLEGYIIDADSDYDGTPCAKEVHKLFDEIDMLNFHPPVGPYERYVAHVKQGIDKAAEEGILRDCGGYSYMSKVSFDHRMKLDEEFAKQWSDDVDWTMQTR